MANTVPLVCCNCRQFLLPIKFSHHTWLVCDNAEGHCYLFAERQVLVLRDGGKSDEEKKGLASARVQRLDYEETKLLYRENYQYARSLGIPSVSARDYRSKSREEIEKAAASMSRVC